MNRCGEETKKLTTLKGLPSNPPEEQRGAFSCCWVVRIQGASVSFPTRGPEGPIRPGDKNKERGLMHQGRLGLGDFVQLVVSDSLWPTGKTTRAIAWSAGVSQPRPGLV